MKKRILSILLAMCMLMSLLPVAAFAADEENGIYPAILHDTRTEGAIDDADLIGEDYDVTPAADTTGAVTGVNKVLTISGSDLRRHQNAEDNMGYWVGVAFVAPDGAKNYKTANSSTKLTELPDGLGSRFDAFSPAELMSRVAVVGNVPKDGFVKYFDLSQIPAENHLYIKLQWLDEEGKALKNSNGEDIEPVVYEIKRDVDIAPPSVAEIGFFADGDKANAAINAVKPSIGLSGTTSDSDKDTMYFAVDNLDPNKYYTAKVKAPGEDGYLTCRDQATANGAIDVRQGTNGAYVLYITFNPTDAKMDTGSWVYTGNTKPQNANNPYKTKAGTYTFELYEAATAEGTPTKVDSATATITLGSVTVKSSADDASPKVAFFNTKDNALKVSDLIAGIADLPDTATTFFAGWKADGGETTLKAAALNDVVPTASVVYTPVFEDVKIDTSKSVTLKKSGEANAVSGVNVNVTEGADNKGTITISGAISGLNNTDSEYTLGFVKNNNSDDTATLNLKLSGNSVVATPTTITVGAYEYAVNVERLQPLVAGVEIADGGAPVVEVPTDDPAVTVGEGDTIAALTTRIEATTGTFDTNNAELSAALSSAASDIKATGETTVTSLLGEIPASTPNKDDYDTIQVVPILDIQLTEHDPANSTMTLNITPKIQYQAVVTGDSTKDPVPVGDPIPVTAENIGPVTISFEKPAFVTASPEPDLYVLHKGYVYTAEYKGGHYEFDNPHGFSDFTVVMSDPTVASTGGNNYSSLQDAIKDVAPNGMITLTGNASNETITGVNKSFTITVSGGGTMPTTLTGWGAANYTVEVTGSGPYTVTATYNEDRGSTGGGSSASVSVPSTSNGKVTVSNSNAKKGDTVTITLTPNTGYVVDTVTVTDSKGNTVEVSKTDDTHYTFVMPDGRVTVRATFKQADTPVTPVTNFTDVEAGAYYEAAVKWAVDNGITNGLTATTFGPNNSCTRGQMVTFLWRAAGSPAATGTNSFTDVASGEYYYNAVLWAVEKGITNGTSATTFSPNATVNRGQTVTFLYRYAESPAATGDSSFTDVAADAFYADAVKWAVAEEITNGTSATTFAPSSNCTRGQIVTFMYRQMAE